VRFHDRRDAGQKLAAQLAREPALGGAQPVIVALPRGGVPVAAEVAQALRAPLAILAVRKLGAPGNPELGVGAIAEDGTTVLDERSARAAGMTQEMLDETVAREAEELSRRVAHYRSGEALIPVAGRAVVIVDDGLATGLTDLAAVRAMRAARAGELIVAVPVGSRESVARLADEADRVVCLTTPRVLFGVGLWYKDFSPVGDDEVLALLSDARARDAERSARRRRGCGVEDDRAAERQRTL
jgi:putative phosphoribosyl transferase